MISIGKMVLDKGFVTLKEAYTYSYSHVQYSSFMARRRLLQMPLACVLIKNAFNQTECYLLEHNSSINYQSVIQLLHGLTVKQHVQKPTLDKETIQSLLKLCHSNRERQIIRCAIYKASGLSETQARKSFGFENMIAHSERAEAAMLHAKYIREAIDQIARMCQHASLEVLGIPSEHCDTSDDDDIDDDECCESNTDSEMLSELVEKVARVFHSSNYNWFEIVSSIPELQCASFEMIQHVANCINTSEVIGNSERKQLLLSFEAFCAHMDINSEIEEREAAAIDGDIVTDSEIDDADSIQRAETPFDPSLKALIQKRVISIQRQASRVKAKKIAAANFLGQKVNHKVKDIVSKYPDIGDKMEEFVIANNVGADAWRRTGILTFDGNIKNTQKVTYEKIRKHLEQVYGRHFSYGTVVQLCVARNKRRKSAQRYKAAAQITTRRARKGFQLRYNPDFHWCNAFYSGLNLLQFSDGRDILNINRDDASGFRLDTLATHKQYSSPTVHGRDKLTTHSDYVNRYPSVLQTTSYNFTGTQTTDEQCIGVVKAAPIFPKNPAQHAADFNMLQSKQELQISFLNPSNGKPKSIICVRVDGASDEGPSHEEVQFWWTLEHIESERVVTLVTARSSGASYLNRVELQNGCLTRGHANLFIPSTLRGNPIIDGKVDETVLESNLQAAIDLYIDHTNQSPCGKTVIHLYKGANSEVYQSYRDHLRVFLKGSKEKKKQLRHSQPILYQKFCDVWKVRSDHMVAYYPPQYVFQLIPCFKPSCCHAVCKKAVGTSASDICWFTGGPPITYLPLPVLDPDRPWGNPNCLSCKGLCSGHYLKPSMSALVGIQQEPPSTIMYQAFKSGFAIDTSEIAKKASLSAEEVEMWIQHLQTVALNRKRGAKKAAETRRAHAKMFYFCGVCEEVYEDETEELENWIGCDNCESWFHWHCVNITNEPANFLCSNCT